MEKMKVKGESDLCKSIYEADMKSGQQLWKNHDIYVHKVSTHFFKQISYIIRPDFFH